MLNQKQERFAQEYVVDHNATQAAIRAGYSADTAVVQASRLLRNVHVLAIVEKLQAAQRERTGVTADTILFELLRIARSDLGQAFDENGNLLPIKEIPEDVRRAISGVETFEEFDGHGADRVKIGETRKLKFWDKTRALELLGKHLGLYVERVDHTSGGAPVRVSFALDKPNGAGAEEL